jgi:hypothetical protein
VTREVLRFLEAYRPEIQAWALGARKLILRVAPDAEEKVLRPCLAALIKAAAGSRSW